MATDKDFINFVEGKLTHIPGIRTKSMFGEYAIYQDNAVVAFVCDNTIYLKILPGTTKLLGEDHEKGPAYPGSKDYYIIDERLLDDDQRMKELILACSADVMAAKVKKPSKRTPRSK